MTESPSLALHPLNKDFHWINADREAASFLTPDQIDQFNDDGFFILRNVFAKNVITNLVAELDPIEKTQQDAIREDPNHYLRDGLETITFTKHLVSQSPMLRAFACNEVFKGICRDLIGPHARLYWDQSVYKKSGKPKEFPWHQDNGYTFVKPQQYITCWVPLVDVDEENGCPWIAKGMHKLGTYEHWATPIGLKCVDNPANALAVPAKAGDVVVFSSLTPHRTGPNLKQGTERKAYILQYIPDNAFAYRDGQEPEPQNDANRQFKLSTD